MSQTVGDVIIIEDSPRYVEITDAVYVPTSPNSWYHLDENWGIYKDGAIVHEAAYIRGPGENLVGQSWLSDVVATDADNGVYIYGGTIQDHFGHFAVSSLARSWCAIGDIKILVHGYQTPQTWFERPFVQEIFNALGLTASSFVCFEAPTRIRRLIVPQPHFQEMRCAHTGFGDFGGSIGAKLLEHQTPNDVANSPVYLSKQQLKTGVWRPINEDDLATRLERGGVEIVYPESLSLAEQIHLLQTRKVISLMGSAHHASIFCTAKANLTILAPEPAVVSNFHLIDAVKNNSPKYLAPKEATHYDGPSNFFLENVRFADPIGIAEDLLRILD